jgi:hypothetical protein
LVEAQDAVASDARGWRNKSREAVVNAAALRFLNARKKMPDGERVARARFIENLAEFGATFFRRACGKIKFG